MPKVELKYLGDDLVISKQTAEQELGLHPGDRVEIRPKADFGPEVQSFEKSRLLTDSLENLRAAFKSSDLDDWETQRNQLWSKWQLPT
ncbi:MAG: hypothetical protein OXC45_02980 [Gemmatimonadetes bacterium]|nr:hypothetical protein [Gemmatimonadota bacterium]